MKTPKKSKLNKEFEQLQKKVEAKLRQASELVKDAHIMVVDADLDFHGKRSEGCKMELSDLVSIYTRENPLVDAMREAGWTVSSTTC